MQGAKKYAPSRDLRRGGKVVNDFGQLVAHALFNTENAKYLFKTKRF